MIDFFKSIFDTNEPMKKRFQGLPRFTYRGGFDPFPDTTLKTDAGWGCCYRASQGVLARYTLLLHEKHRDLYNHIFGTKRSPLALFADVPKMPFSIHQLVRAAKVTPGEWAKPSQVAIAINTIFNNLHLGCYASLQSGIELEVLEDLNYPALLLISLRCGLDNFEEKYLEFIRYILDRPESLGIVSGYSGSAYYIVGADNDHAFYYDPHTCQDAVKSTKEFGTYSHPPLLSMNLSQLNPSILICFALETKEDAICFSTEISSFTNSPVIFSNVNIEQLNNLVLDIDDLDL